MPLNTPETGSLIPDFNQGNRIDGWVEFIYLSQ